MVYEKGTEMTVMQGKEKDRIQDGFWDAEIEDSSIAVSLQQKMEKRYGAMRFWRTENLVQHEVKGTFPRVWSIIHKLYESKNPSRALLIKKICTIISEIAWRPSAAITRFPFVTHSFQFIHYVMNMQGVPRVLKDTESEAHEDYWKVIQLTNVLQGKTTKDGSIAEDILLDVQEGGKKEREGVKERALKTLRESFKKTRKEWKNEDESKLVIQVRNYQAIRKECETLERITEQLGLKVEIEGDRFVYTPKSITGGDGETKIELPVEALQYHIYQMDSGNAIEKWRGSLVEEKIELFELALRSQKNYTMEFDSLLWGATGESGNVIKSENEARTTVRRKRGLLSMCSAMGQGKRHCTKPARTGGASFCIEHEAAYNTQESTN